MVLLVPWLVLVWLYGVPAPTQVFELPIGVVEIIGLRPPCTKQTGINEKVVLGWGIPDTNGYRIYYTYLSSINFGGSTMAGKLTCI